MANLLLTHEQASDKYPQTFKILGQEYRNHIRFTPKDILFHQKQIVAIWRSLNKSRSKPIAKTFLGRIVAISFLT